jgi:DNA mismatch repair protein MutL
MSRIHLLDSSTINKIAAGEVIERPVSVVKELVENSIDANSDEIIVKLKDGGKKEITVIDNGSGMDDQDLELSIVRHATSKISKIEDVYSIFSYGFRGEALATIADVSKLEITSAILGKDQSNQIQVEHGKILKKTIFAYRKGTTITVQNLFYNIPARQKFLKTSNYELKKIVDWIKSIAVSNPQIEFKIVIDGKEIYHFSRKQNYEERIRDIYSDIARDLVSGTYKDPLVSTTVFVSKPNKVDERGTTCVYVNNRPIKNLTVLSAVKKAYEAKIPRNYKPNAVIFLDINPHTIDINVHPQKLEIRVKEDSQLFLPTYNAVKNALEQVKETEIDKTRPTQLISTINTFVSEKAEEVKTSEKQLDFVFKPDENQIQKSLNMAGPEKTASAKVIKNFRIIGQVFNSYILVEKNGSLFIFDQHVAEERYNFEEIKKQYNENKGLLKQELLVPFGFILPYEDRAILMENKKELEKLGFEVDELRDEILVRSVPLKVRNTITKDETKELLLDIIREIKTDIADKQNNLFATIACKMSVKAGMPLNELQMEKIIENLFTCENPFTCPHGRPTFMELSKDRIEKEVHRK